MLKNIDFKVTYQLIRHNQEITMIKTLKSVFILCSLFLYYNVQAAVFIPTLTIDETFNASTQTGAYSVNNTSGYDIFAFAVGSNDAITAWTTYRDFWAATTLDQQSWDAGYYLGSAGVDSVDYDFSNYFSGYSVANVYNRIDDFAIANGENTGFEFFFSARVPASPFVAFYDAGNSQVGVLTGHTSVVPVPSATLLFLSGIIGVFRVRKLYK